MIVVVAWELLLDLLHYTLLLLTGHRTSRRRRRALLFMLPSAEGLLYFLFHPFLLPSAPLPVILRLHTKQTTNLNYILI